MLISLFLPPGAYRNGTAYQASGRWFDTNRVRWSGPALRPIGGWRAKTASTLTGMARAAITWRDNDGSSWAAFGTHSNLFAMARDGTVTDITPDDFTTGAPGSAAGGGYGSGNYGAGTYGTPRADVDDVSEASVWSLDTYGEYLIGCMGGDGRIYEWDVDTGHIAAPISNAPSACSAVFVTAERNVVALGAGANPRRVEWSDSDDNTVWAATAANSAGGQSLQTNGALKCGKRIRGGALLFTDLDVWLMAPTYNEFIYGFEQVGTACGVIGKQAAAVIDERCVWMSQDGFFIFAGGVAPLDCDVRDYVFGDFNRLQGAKVHAAHLSEFFEVWWFYPSGASLENDRYVKWNYQTGAWDFGTLDRTCAADRGAFAYPLMAGPDGAIFEHEVGFHYPDAVMPFAEGGPVELGAGDAVMRVTKLIPDERVSGEVEVSFRTRLSPNGEVSEAGPYALSPRTDVRFTGRQVAIRYEGAGFSDWRVGVVRADVTPGGLR